MYEVTKEGMKKVEKMPETTVLDGNQFGWSLKGYSDREIAKVDYNRATEKNAGEVRSRRTTFLL